MIAEPPARPEPKWDGIVEEPRKYDPEVGLHDPDYWWDILASLLWGAYAAVALLALRNGTKGLE